MALNVVSTDRLSTNVNTTNLNASFGQLANRSVIINGGMQVSQRATTSASITTGGYHTVDRWYTTITSAGTWTQYQDADVPTGKGFSKSLSFDCTTADASLAAGDRIMFSYRLEGQDLLRFGKGTSGAKKYALSFWVKSPKTGTHIVELFDHDNSRHICKAYTIASANTWEQKELIIDNETSNAFGNDNGKSLEIQFYLAAGSNYTSGTLATAWAANTNANRAVGQVNCADSTSNKFFLTGVQLEAGDDCTEFEHRSYADELRRCQRYLQVTDDGGCGIGSCASTSAGQRIQMDLKTTMRASPTVTKIGNNIYVFDGTNAGQVSATSAEYGTPHSIEWEFSSMASGSVATGRPCIGYINGSAGGFKMEAEM